MNRTEVTVGIVRYQLPPHEGKHFGCETLEAFFAMAGGRAPPTTRSASLVPLVLSWEAIL